MPQKRGLNRAPVIRSRWARLAVLVMGRLLCFVRLAKGLASDALNHCLAHSVIHSEVVHGLKSRPHEHPLSFPAFDSSAKYRLHDAVLLSLRQPLFLEMIYSFRGLCSFEERVAAERWPYWRDFQKRRPWGFRILYQRCENRRRGRDRRRFKRTRSMVFRCPFAHDALL